MSESYSESSGMDHLLQLAEGVGAGEDEVLKFSAELTAMANRLSDLTREKLQVEFENRELKTRMVPVQIELDSAKEEVKFLKNQAREFWAEIESISKQKNEVFRERCETVRKLTDEVASLSAEKEADRNRIEFAETEKEKMRQQSVSDRSEFRAKLEASEVEGAALREKMSKQRDLIAVLEQQGEVTARLEEQVNALRNEVGEKNLNFFEAQEQIANLKTEKEQLLEKLVRNRENKKAVSAVSVILGKESWNLSDLVDSLSFAKSQVGEKQKEINSLHSVIEEMKEKLPEIESTYAQLERSEAELQHLKKYNEQIKSEFERREDEMDQLKFEKLKLETDYQSLQLRCSDMGRQLAVMVHESESLRGRIGLHAGPGRSHPMLLSPEASAATSNLIHSTAETGSVVAHFRTVSDLVEQNLELKQKMDKLLNESETEAQQQVGKLRVQYEKLETLNSDLVARREQDKADFDRTVERLSSELTRARTEADRLRKCVLTGGFLNEEDVDMDNNEAIRTAEFKKHLASVNGELETARQVCARTVAELDRIREDLKREIDEKNHFSRSFERLKSESTAAIDQAKNLKSRLNAVELEKDSLIAKLDEFKSRDILNEKQKREFEHQISGLKAAVAANEKAFRDLASEKESQSAVLVGYHSRLDQESRMYHTNSENLRRVYEQEFEKSKSTLNFYQTAYEEQVKRANELGAQVAKLHAELDEGKSERHRILRLSEASSSSSVLASLPSPSQIQSLQREVERLEAELRSVTEDVEKWRDIAKVNEGLVEQLRLEIDQLRDQEKSHETETDADVDVVMGGSSQEVVSDQLVESLSEELRSVRAQLEDKSSQYVSEKAESDRRLEELETLRAIAGKISQLEESLHKERLLLSVNESEFSEALSALRIRADLADQERSVSEQKIALLVAENDRYLRYFASDLSSAEKEEEGNLVIQQLQNSITSHSLRESQLLSDLQRCRSTMDMLLHENQTFKTVSQERDTLVVQVRVAEERVASASAESNRCRTELESVLAQHSSLTAKLVAAEDRLVELSALKDQVARFENETKLLKEQLDQASGQANEYRNLHSELALKISSGSVSTDHSAELEAKIVQLEKAKSQLTQTVSKLREEAERKNSELTGLSDRISKFEADLNEKTREISQQESVIISKDKRISELEAAQTSEKTEQLMDLVSDYQSALSSLLQRTNSTSGLQQPPGDDPVSPSSEGTAKKRRKDHAAD